MALPLVGGAIAGIAIVLAKFLVPYIIIRAIITLGLSVVTFIGVNLLVDFIVTSVWSGVSGLPSDITALMYLMGAFDWLAVMLAAWVAAVNIRLTRGSFKRISIL